MIKGLDDDEIQFLDLVDRTKLEEERKKNMEEEKEMRDFKAAVASLQEKTMDEKLKQELKKPQSTVKNVTPGARWRFLNDWRYLLKFCGRGSGERPLWTC